MNRIHFIRMITHFFLISVSFLLTLPLHAYTITEIQVPGHNVNRILEYSPSNTYWIVSYPFGLICLSEVSEDSWEYIEYPTSYIYDAAGPDSSGMLYLTYKKVGETGIYVFNCSTRSIVSSIILGTDYGLRGLCLSNDESRLYVLGWDWPRIGEYGGSGETTVHRNSGLLWEIDTTTLEVLDQCAVSALPETIYYTDNGNLLIDNKEEHYCFEINSDCEEAMIDVITTELRLSRIAQIPAIYENCQFLRDIIRWSDEEPLVALINADLDYNRLDDDRYDDAIWIINTDTNEVVDSIEVLYEGTAEYGIYLSHAIVSSYYYDTVYGSILI
ncbi:MAG: hypothetical protein NTY09_01230 [bacterium]|nr:hypothetical protein [bacterium]